MSDPLQLQFHQQPSRTAMVQMRKSLIELIDSISDICIKAVSTTGIIPGRIYQKCSLRQVVRCPDTTEQLLQLIDHYVSDKNETKTNTSITQAYHNLISSNWNLFRRPPAGKCAVIILASQ